MSTFEPNITANSQVPDTEDTFTPLTKDAAAIVRASISIISPWRVIGIQTLVGILLSAVVGTWFDSLTVFWSFAYGAWSVVLPGAVLAFGLHRSRSSAHPGLMMLNFFFWELIKIVLTVAMLAIAPLLILNLSWPAMIAGLIVTMKVYFIAGFLQRNRPSTIESI